MTQARPPVVLGNGEGDGRTRRVAAVSMVVEFVSREVRGERGELGGLRLRQWAPVLLRSDVYYTTFFL